MGQLNADFDVKAVRKNANASSRTISKHQQVKKWAVQLANGTFAPSKVVARTKKLIENEVEIDQLLAAKNVQKFLSEIKIKSLDNFKAIEAEYRDVLADVTDEMLNDDMNNQMTRWIGNYVFSKDQETVIAMKFDVQRQQTAQLITLVRSYLEHKGVKLPKSKLKAKVETIDVAQVAKEKLEAITRDENLKKLKAGAKEQATV